MLRNWYIILALAIAFPRIAHAGPGEPIDEGALYFYKAKIVDVHDGDTVTADINLGFYIWVHQERLRLQGIDAPEVTGREKKLGTAARDFLRDKILGKEVLIQTIQDRNQRDSREKYGRYLAVIWLNGVNINDLLVKEGYAVNKQYK